MPEPNRLYDGRMLSGLTLGQAAKILGCTRQHLGDLEWDRVSATEVELASIAAAYDVRMAWLRGATRSDEELIRMLDIPAAQLATLKPDDRAKLLANLDAICEGKEPATDVT